MKMGFNPKESTVGKIILQFNFSAQVDGQCYFEITNNEIESVIGPAENPDLTIVTPFEVWMDILTGKADGAEMLMGGKYTVEGNTDLLLKIGELFGG